MGKKILWVLVLLSLFITLPLAYQRLQLENQNRSCEIIMDYQDILRLSKEHSRPLPETFFALKKSGVTTIALVEDNLFRLQEERNILTVSSDENHIKCSDPVLLKRIYDNLALILGTSKVTYEAKGALKVHGYFADIAALGLGINPAKKRYLESFGFKVVPRIYNEPRFTALAISQKISSLKGFPLVIFAEDEILGYPKDIQATAQALKKNQVAFGYIELAKQRGDRELTLASGENFKKVHSITAYEIRHRKVTPSQGIQRYVRAVKERGIRYLYFHPFDTLGLGAIDKNAEIIFSLKNGLLASGYEVSSASQFSGLKIGDVQIKILTLSLIAAFILLFNYFIPLKEYLNLVLCGTLFLLFLIISFLVPSLLINQLLALAASIVFPSLAIIYAFNFFKGNRFVLNFIGLWLFLVGITMIGALFIVAFLADNFFVIGTRSFIAIKFALFIPLFIIMLYFLGFYAKAASFKEKIANFASLQVPVTKFLLALVGVGAILIILARSDNFVLPVLDLEELFRGFLEKLLFIRPRTKEFLIGWPLLFCGIIYYLKGQKKYLWVFLTFGAIALTSLTNTFCHIHTPLVTSVLRSFIGLMFGFVLGLVLYFCLSNLKTLKP